MKTLIQELEQQTIQELTQVANKYPYVAIYRMVLAKKLKQDGSSTKEFNHALAQASLRVPSRIVLKDYLEREIYSEEILTTEKNKSIFQSDLTVEPLVNDATSQEESISTKSIATNTALASVPVVGAILSSESTENKEETLTDSQNNVKTSAEIIQEEEEEDSKFDSSMIEDEEGEEIEVEIYQEEVTNEQEIETFETKEDLNTLTTSNNDNRNTPTQEEQDIEVEIYEIPKEQVIHSEEEKEFLQSSNQTEEDSIEVEISQLDEDLTLQYTNDSNFETSNENNNLNLPEQLEEDSEQTNDNQEEEHQKGLTIDEFQEALNVKQKDALFHYHGFDDDEIERIGNELIHEEEAREQLKLDNDQRVEDLKVNEHDSVYKKVVEILKQDSYNFSSQESSTSHIIPSSNIIDESLEDIHEEEKLTELVSNKKNTQDKEIQELNEKLDEELDLLYAQSSYESSLEYEIQEMQKQDTENIDEKEYNDTETSIQIQEKVEEPQENSLPRKDSHSFFAWLDKFSTQKEQKNEPIQPQTAEKKQVEEETKPKVDFKQEEVDNQYRDSDDDLDDEITKEVQEKAKKSMTKNRSYYTETLAYIYEQQDKWEKAIEVYQELILKNPEKSAYFASQINLLREKIETE